MASDDDTKPRWLQWARRLQAIGQTGLAYHDDDFDTERYQALLEIAAEIVTSHTSLPAEPVLRSYLAQQGHATPRVDVRAAVVREGRVLLVQERSDGRWAMPGGWADVGESPAEIVVREVREESGFLVRPRKVAGIFEENRQAALQQLNHAYKIVFLCELTGGEATPSFETAAVEFFDPDELPPLSPVRTDQRHIDEVKAHLADPERPAAFE